MKHKKVSISNLRQEHENWHEKQIEVRGWIRYNRFGKKVSFLVLEDGSSIEGIQIVYRSESEKYVYKEIGELRVGSALICFGTAKKPFNAKEKIEIELEDLKIIAKTTEDYQLQKKEQGLDFLRKNSHIRGRTLFYQSIFRVRQILFEAVHSFFWKNEFIFLAASTITKNDCEGAGESFVLSAPGKKKDEFFNEKALLSVSSQMQAEAWAQAFQKVYTFGPTYRADRSKTSFHAAEFWMIEPELAFGNLDDVVDLSRNLIQFLAEELLKKGEKELVYLSEKNNINLQKRAKDLLKNDFFQRISYTEAVERLKKANIEISWGENLSKKHEHSLCSLMENKAIFVTDYPKDLKAFYMKKSSPKTVLAFDLLFPEIGEVIGGSERENDFDKLVEAARKKQIEIENIEWYLDLRKKGFGGSAGFGLGFDRLILYFSGATNIRDVIPFYVGFQSLNY